MPSRRLIALLLSALLWATPALAARWISIGGKTPATQARIEVDSSSLGTVGEGKVRIWHRETHSKPKIPDSGAFSFTRLTMLTEFQCEKRSAALISRSYTAADGSELKSETFDTRETTTITPDSSLEVVFNYACKQAKKPPVEPPKTAEAKPGEPAKAADPAPAAVVAEVKEVAKKGGKKPKEEVHHAPHWTYSGSTGADKWGSLDPEFAACSQGQRQSPIDIRSTVRADLPPIEFAYQPTPLAIVDNGHSIKVDTADAGEITVDGETYALLQFHFHKPSEEKLNGKSYPMVAHLVHQSKAGKLAVVAVLFEAGKEQKLIRTLWNNLPLEAGKPVVRPDLKIDPTLLLPAKRGYYTFLGSLTTPPCTEGVLWLVLKTPVQVSSEQLAGLATIYKSNARPTQAVNGRLIKESR
jgi:carbonic anhydrase